LNACRTNIEGNAAWLWWAHAGGQKQVVICSGEILMNNEKITNQSKFSIPPLLGCFLVFIFVACIAVVGLAVVFVPPIYKSLSFNYYLQRGISNYSKSNFKDAIPDFTQVIQIQPDYEAAYMYRGDAYARMGNYANAKLDFEAQIRLSPSSPNGYNNLCWYGSLFGDVNNVLSACKKAVDLAPNDPHCRDSRGLARALTNDYEGAILDFQFFVDRVNTDRSITSEKVEERKSWIASLKKGINPFDAAEIQRLFHQ
jgi:tetratricopeptide (TPR) repeat protein